MTCEVIDKSCEELDLEKIAEEKGYTGKRADVLCICGDVAVIIEETSGRAKREDVRKLLASVEFLKNANMLTGRPARVCYTSQKGA
ncbi:MAG: hypothetical protein ABWK05_07225 [Pyrobaculum sp.]